MNDHGEEGTFDIKKTATYATKVLSFVLSRLCPAAMGDYDEEMLLELFGSFLPSIDTPMPEDQESFWDSRSIYKSGIKADLALLLRTREDVAGYSKTLEKKLRAIEQDFVTERQIRWRLENKSPELTSRARELLWIFIQELEQCVEVRMQHTTTMEHSCRHQLHCHFKFESGVVSILAECGKDSTAFCKAHAYLHANVPLRRCEGFRIRKYTGRTVSSKIKHRFVSNLFPTKDSISMNKALVVNPIFGAGRNASARETCRDRGSIQRALKDPGSVKERVRFVRQPT